VPRITMTLFTGSILAILCFRFLARQISFAHSTPMVNLLLVFTLLVCGVGALALLLETPSQDKHVEETIETDQKVEKRKPHDNQR